VKWVSHAKTKGFFEVFWRRKALGRLRGGVRTGGIRVVRGRRRVEEFQFLDVGFGDVTSEEDVEVVLRSVVSSRVKRSQDSVAVLRCTRMRMQRSARVSGRCTQERQLSPAQQTETRTQQPILAVPTQVMSCQRKDRGLTLFREHLSNWPGRHWFPGAI